MGLVYGEWAFRAGAVPSADAVAGALAKATGLEVRLEADDPPGGQIAMHVPHLGQRLIKWRFDNERLAVHGFVPAHPYLWENLDAVLAGFGGRPGPAEHGWRPEARMAGLRRPWAELGPAERMLLRLPGIGPWRPLDGLVARRG
jgi:hypothetical protein